MANYDLIFPGTVIDDILETGYDLQNAGYIFRGLASGYTGTPSHRSWVIAGEGETGHGLTSAVPAGSIGICMYDGSSWTARIVSVLGLDSTPTTGSGNAVSSGGVASALSSLSVAISQSLESMRFTDSTPAADQGRMLGWTVTMTAGGVLHAITTFGLLAATASKAGLMSAEDKQKVDGFLETLQSMGFEDTTPTADAGTKIVETLSMEIGGVETAVTALTILAATASKAGLMSASDKAYLDGIPASLSSIGSSIDSVEYDISRLMAMLGYYVCDTAAATADKAVYAAGYRLTTGGCIRIKMTNANTANNVTLNINSTGAKALYYNGQQASSANSWEACEVLEVYYDGTQYQCASGGGGGKFATGENVADVGITDMVLTDSSDIITSGGVDAAFRGGSRTDNYTAADAVTAGILLWNGTVGTYSGWYVSDKINLIGAKTLVATGLYYSASVYMGFALYDSQDNVLYRNASTSISLDITQYPTASYMRFCRSNQTIAITIIFESGLLPQVTSKMVEEGDNMPVAGDAVFKAIQPMNIELNGYERTYTKDDCDSDTLLNSNGSTRVYAGYYTSDYIPVGENYSIICTNLYPNDAVYHGLHFYDENKSSTEVQPALGITSNVDFSSYPTVKYVRFCGQENASVTVRYTNSIRQKLDEIYPTAENLGHLFDLTQGTFGITEVIQGSGFFSDMYAIATAAHSASTMTGLLAKIRIKVNKAGRFKIGVGVLDQNMIPVIRDYIVAEAQYAGYNEIDVSGENCIIKEGEQIFFAYDSSISDVKINYWTSNNQDYADDNCPYGTLSGLSFYGIAGTYLLFTLAYDVIEIRSVFALQSQIEELQKNIDSVQQNSMIWDENGISYRLRVVGGSIVPVPQVYRKVVVLGNSLTWHEYNANIGWYGKDRSMASTTNETSWPYMFERILRRKQPTATVTGVMMRNWETAGDGNRNIQNIPSTKALLDAALASDTDLIIFRCGENGTVSSATTYAQEIKSLIDYCLNTAPSASVVLCGLFWPNAVKDAAILSVANDYHYQYVTAGSAFGGNVEISGDYMVDSEDGQQKRIGTACLSHTNDYGFYQWANHIASQVGYGSDVLDELHEVNISSTLSNPYRIKTTKSPYKSLVTILVQESSQPTVNVTAGGTSIQTTIHELTNAGAFTFAITFIQPDSDVTVTLS